MRSVTRKLKKIPIVGFEITVQTFDDAIDCFEVWAQDWEHPRYVPFTAVYTLARAKIDAAQAKALHQADMLPADGMPLVWLQKHYHQYQEAERIRATNAFATLIERTAESDVSHYFWGGEAHATETLVHTLREQYPNIKIAGYHSPPFTSLEDEINPEVIERINTANPHIVWVCLGSIKQDQWMAMYRPYLKAPLLMGVGVSFYFYTGLKPQAPLWMQALGLEWLFRLLKEPKRLAKRYIYYNVLFVMLLMLDMLKNGFSGRGQAQDGQDV